MHRVLARVTRARAHIAVPRYVGSQSQRAYWNSPVGSRRLALAGAAVLEAIPGVPVSMVTGYRELSSTRTVAHRERGWPARNSEPTGNTVNSNTSACTGTDRIYVASTSRQVEFTSHLQVLNVAFTPKIYVAHATRCELSSKVTVDA